MGIQITTQTAEPAFALERDEPVKVRQVSLIPRKRALKRKKLGQISEHGRVIQVWAEGGAVRFRRHRSRRVESISILDLYHHVVGQKELRLQ